jgi:dipeptidyl aminopeptidase/acylaminoacyl peptidase
MSLHRLARHALGLIACAAGLAQAQTPPPTEAYIALPGFASPQLSPDGKHVAAIVSPDGKTPALVIIDTARPTEAMPLKAFAEADIRSVFWLDDKRLVFDVRERADGEGRSVANGLWAINSDGSDFKVWADPGGWGGGKTQATKVMDANSGLYARPRKGGNEVVMRTYRGDAQRLVNQIDLTRLDTVSGARQKLSVGAPTHLTFYVFDHDGAPLFGQGLTDDGQGRIYRNEGDKGWTLWDQYDLRPQRQPLAVDAKGRLILLREVGGRYALHRAESLAPDAPSEPLVNVNTVDIDPGLVFDRDSGDLVGTRIETDKPQMVWFDETLAAAQAKLDAQLPGRANLVDCQRCSSVPLWLVTSLSDRDPPRYYLFDHASGQLKPLAAARPGMPSGATTLSRRIEARDGRALPVQITLPLSAGAQPGPAVVRVHDGPWQRGNHWAWQAERQWLAARGYRVIEVDFRGSLGYGRGHFQAGWREWGRAMQDDLDDALAWAVAQGVADPARTCIMGEGYGGYAALMAQVRQGASPKAPRYACTVAAFAPTDPLKLLSRYWAALPGGILNGRLPRLLGDSAADAQRLTEVSPLAQAAQIKGPVLLAYGEVDSRVPPVHGTDLRDALARNDNPAVWLSYAREGHGLYKPGNLLDYYRHLEAFLAQHLTPPH